MGIVQIKKRKPRGMVRVTPKKSAGPVQVKKCPPNHRWTWGGCKPSIVRVSDVSLDRIRQINQGLKDKYSHLAEADVQTEAQGRSLADLIKKASSHAKPTGVAKPKPKPKPKKKKTSTKTRLEYVGSNYQNQSGKSSKFYEVTVSGTKVTLRWGKIGTYGQSKVHDKGGEFSAMAFAKSQIAKKKAKGYKQV